MTMTAGSVVVADDGTVTKSGMAEAIYDAFVAGYANDTGGTLDGPEPQVTVTKKGYATISTRVAEGVINYLCGCLMTPEHGLTVPLLNKTGAPSVKGTVVQASETTAEAFDLQRNQSDAIGICYEDGVADGDPCRVVVAGVADVLLADGAGSTVHDWVAASPTHGRAYSVGASPPPTHFWEIGHSLQTVAGGTDVLCRVAIHFL